MDRRRECDDLDELESAVELLRESLPVPKPEKPRTVADRRWKESIYGELSALVHFRRWRIEKAREHHDLARGLGPDLRGAKRLEPLILFAEENYKDARKRAQRWIDNNPDDLEVDAVLVWSLLRLGWWDLATLKLSAWPQVHPRDLEGLLELWGEVEKVRAASTLGSREVVGWFTISEGGFGSAP